MLYTTPPSDFNPDLEVAGCIIEYDGKILMLQNRDDKLEWWYWGSAAGKLERWETHYDAMIREVQEETWINLKKENPKFFQTMYCEQSNHKLIYYLYHCILQKQPHIQVTEEHQDMQWIEPEKALKIDLMKDEGTCIAMVFWL